MPDPGQSDSHRDAAVKAITGSSRYPWRDHPARVTRRSPSDLPSARCTPWSPRPSVHNVCQ